MKKVMPLLLVLLILLTSTCFAAYEPDPNRWIWISSDDEIGAFLDKETIEYSADGIVVDFWLCYVYPKDKQYAIVNHIINKSEKTLTLTHISIYNADTRKLIESYTPNSWEQEAERIIPDTNGEILYRYFFPK